jgi:hypothetical protein
MSTMARRERERAALFEFVSNQRYLSRMHGFFNSMDRGREDVMGA